MKPMNTLKFSLDDRIEDVEVSPAHVPLALLNQFQKDVTDFLKGSGRDIDPAHVQISIENGSLRFAASGLLAATTLWTDMGILNQPDFMDKIDPKRAEVIENWQTSAHKFIKRSYSIFDMDMLSLVKVDNSTGYHRQPDEAWVTVEKYLFGQILDLGGKSKTNVHLELEDGQSLTIASSQDLIAKEEKNRVYKPALLHVTAEENLYTGKLRKIQLLSFESYSQSYDDNAFNKMVERGTDAWSDIKDSADWIDELRGGSH